MISTQVLHTAIPPCRGLFVNHRPVNCQLVGFDMTPWVYHMRRRNEEHHDTRLRSLSEVIFSMTETEKGDYTQNSVATIVDTVVPHGRAYVKCEVNGGTVGVILEDVTPYTVAHERVTWSLSDDGVTPHDMRQGSTDFAAAFDETYGLFPTTGDSLPVKSYVTAKVLGETEGCLLIPIEYLWIDQEEDNISEHSQVFLTSYSATQLRDIVPVVEIDPPAYVILE